MLCSRSFSTNKLTISPVSVWIKRIIKRQSIFTQCNLLFNVNGYLIFLSFPVLKDGFYYWFFVTVLLIYLFRLSFRIYFFSILGIISYILKWSLA